MKLNFKFGSAVTNLPAAAAEKIVSGAASHTETAVLMAVALHPDRETESDGEYLAAIAELTGLEESDVSAALAFWRGASVLTMASKTKTAPKPGMVSESAKKNAAPPPQKTEEPTKDVVNPKETVESAPQPAPKALMRAEVPKYDSLTISQVLEKDGGALTFAIDQCQRAMGWVFNPHEVAIIVGLNDYLGLEPEYILTLCTYYAAKKPNCKLHYIEKAAFSLVNDGVTSVEALETHIKGLELYDGIAGHLRKLMGIGSRSFTKKENGKINHWISDLGYGSDVIELCYEITVDAIGEFSFDYADKVLDGWYMAGARNLEQAKQAAAAFRSEKQAAAKGASPSFDGDDFLELAIRRSTGK